jgi:hypothetical protein
MDVRNPVFARAGDEGFAEIQIEHSWKILNLLTRELVPLPGSKSYITSPVAFSPTEKEAIVGVSIDDTPGYFEIYSRTFIPVPATGSFPREHPTFSPDGRYAFISYMSESGVALFDLRTGTPVQTPHTSDIEWLSPKPFGARSVVACGRRSDGEWSLYDLCGDTIALLRKQSLVGRPSL